MPIPFNCPECGKHTLVADVYSGKTGPCSGCGADVTVPELTDKVNKPLSPLYILVPIGAALRIGILAVFAIAAAVVPRAGGAAQVARVAASVPGSSNNLKLIGLALHNYHDVHGTLPPAYVIDEDGQRTTSWCVLIVPYAASPRLAEQYDHEAAWDSLENRSFRNTGPAVFSADPRPAYSTFETSYLLLTGPGTAFEAGNAASVGGFSNPLADIAIAVGVRSSGIEWSEPRDLLIDDLPAWLNSGKLVDGNGRVTILMADGGIQAITPAEAAQKLRQMAMTGAAK